MERSVPARERVARSGWSVCEFCGAPATWRYSFWRWFKADGHKFQHHLPIWLYACDDHEGNAWRSVAKPLKR